MTKTQELVRNKLLKAQVVADTVLVLTNNINVTIQDKKILAGYVDEWLDGICLEPNISDSYDFYDSCFYKMKSCDNPTIQKIYKQTLVNIKKQRIEQDFI